MIKEAICTGKTVEEALEKAYAELGVDSDSSEFEILERPKRTLFGLKVIPAKVRVTTEVPDEKPAPPAAGRAEGEGPKAPASETNKAKAECAASYLRSIFHEMGLDQVELSVQEKEDGAVFTLSGEGLGVLIGRRGETLDALQYLSGLVANRLEGEYFRVTIDSGNYREKREKTLEQLAKKLSNQVVKTGRNLTLEPMNPYERRIIHATVQNIEGVTSASIGEEPNRRVVISSTNPRKKPAGKGGNNRGRGGRPGGSGGNRGGGRSGKPGGGRDGNRGGRSYDNHGKPGSNVVTRSNAFGDSKPKRIDDSALEIEPPVVRAPSAPKAPEPKPQPNRSAAPEELKDKPLYSKIDID